MWGQNTYVFTMIMKKNLNLNKGGRGKKEVKSRDVLSKDHKSEYITPSGGVFLLHKKYVLHTQFITMIAIKKKMFISINRTDC